MIELLIVADDLTGANDSGAQLAKRGIPTLVTYNLDVDFKALMPEVEVVVVDTESRHISPDVAAVRVRRVACRAAEAGVSYFYKKTDSTLRGNIGAELEALMAATDRDVLAFIPAYPKTGRFTRQGFQYVGNELLHHTAFGQDPLEPMVDSFVPAIVARQSHLKTFVISPGGDEAEAALQHRQSGIYIFNCDNDGDLRHIGDLLIRYEALQVTAGPAGFAELLPELLQMTPRTSVGVNDRRPILLVNGSMNEMALKQVAFARRYGFYEIVVPPEVLLAESALSNAELKPIIDQVSGQIAQGRDIVVRSLASHEELNNYLTMGEAAGIPSDQVHAIAGDNLGLLIARILEAVEIGNLVVFGGDTLLGVMRALGCQLMFVKDEIKPGVVLANVIDSSATFNLITKAGGFGGEEVVLDIVNYLRKDG